MATSSVETIAALIPAYNPDRKMTDVIEELKNHFTHIIVVNDGCSSEYDDIFKEIEGTVTVLKHPVNKGKGCALKTGFAYVLENHPELLGVVTLDADGQHTATDVVNCCQVFLENPKTSVFGCRDFKSDVDIPKKSRYGNRLTSSLLKLLCGIELSDTQTGLRVLPTSCLSDLLNTAGERYEYEMNMIFDLHKLGVGWVENQISVIYLDNNESSHFNPVKDSIKIYKVFFKYGLSSMAQFFKYCGSSLLCALIDVIAFTIFLNVFKDVSIFNGAIESIVLSTYSARIISGLCNFIINKMIFAGKSKTAASGIKYFIVWIIQMNLSAYCVKGVAFLLPFINQTIIKCVIDTILFFISFGIQKKWVFKSGDKK